MLAAVLHACASRAPRVAVGPLGEGLDGFLAAHPLGPRQSIRADEVARTAEASYHLVQVRGREPPHLHATHDLAVFVLAGRGTLTLHGARLALAAGDVALVPRGSPHWFATTGHGESVALVVFMPPLDAPYNVPVDSSPDGG